MRTCRKLSKQRDVTAKAVNEDIDPVSTAIDIRTVYFVREVGVTPYRVMPSSPTLSAVIITGS